VGSGVARIGAPDPSQPASITTPRPGWWRRAARLLSGDTARQGYLSAFDQALISLTNFIASVLLARAVTPTQFGAYGVGFLLLHLARAFQEGLIIQPMSALAASMSDDVRRRYLTGSASLQLVLALAGALACALGGKVLTDLGNTVAGPTLFALWSPVLLAQVQEFLRRVLYVRGDVPLAVINTTVTSLARVVFLTWVLAGGATSGTVGLAAIAWGGAAGLAVGAIQTRRLWVGRGAEVLGAWRRNWALGRWVLGGTTANWVAVEVFPILTAGLVSFAATGVYRAVQNVVAPVHALLRAMDTYFTPRLADRRQASGSTGVVDMVRRMFVVTGPAVAVILVGAVVFPDPLLRVLYGETYGGYGAAMRWMALFYACLYLYSPIQSALKAVQMTRPIFLGSAAATLSMFTVGVWMILRWGVYGTIAGQALSAAIVAGVLWASWIGWRRSETARPVAARAAPPGESRQGG